MNNFTEFDHLAIDWGSKKSGIAIGSKKSALVIPKAIVDSASLLFEIHSYLEKYPIHTIIISENKSFFNKETRNSIQQKELQAQLLATIHPGSQLQHVLLFSERGTTRSHGKNNDDRSAAELLLLYFSYT